MFRLDDDPEGRRRFSSTARSYVAAKFSFEKVRRLSGGLGS
jgi:hypothetical protein